MQISRPEYFLVGHVDEAWKYRNQQAPQVIIMLVIMDYSSINKQWLKEVQILSFLDSQRVWEENFKEK